MCQAVLYIKEMRPMNVVIIISLFLLSVSVKFLNSVRLWDFIEEREHRAVPQYEDEVNDLGELFMQLSGAGEESGTSASP